MLERFGSNGLGHTPGRFHTSVHRINLPLTVFSVEKSIPNHSEAPPAVDSPESYGSESVGSGRWFNFQPLAPTAPSCIPPVPTNGRRLRQRRLPRPSHMHQDIDKMSLVHVLRLFSHTRPPACCLRRHSPAFARCQPPAPTATQHDAGRRGNVCTYPDVWTRM